MKRELIGTMTLAAAVIASGTAAWGQQTIDRTLPAQPDVEISVENIAGQVTIHPGEDHQVRLHAVLGADVDDFEIEGDETEYYVEVDVDDHDWGHRKVDITSTIELWVPVGASVEVETVSAGVDVSGISGGAAVESVSGSINLQGVSGGIEAESVSGRITIAATGGTVHAESVSGQVEVSGARGEIHAGAVSGSVRVTDFSGHEAYMESVSGSVRFDGDLAAGAELSVETVSGSVELSLPADLAAEFDIETFSGSIESAFGGEVRQVSQYGPGKLLGYSTGDDAEICVETLSGSVTISHR